MQAIELTGQDYIVYFEDNEEMSYQFCNQLLRELRRKFPGKTFMGMSKDIEFKELDDEELDSLIGLLSEIKERRLSAATVDNVEEESTPPAEIEENKEEKDAE